jgi:hypothetical protein
MRESHIRKAYTCSSSCMHYTHLLLTCQKTQYTKRCAERTYIHTLQIQNVCVCIYICVCVCVYIHIRTYAARIYASIEMAKTTWEACSYTPHIGVPDGLKDIYPFRILWHVLRENFRRLYNLQSCRRTASVWAGAWPSVTETFHKCGPCRSCPKDMMQGRVLGLIAEDDEYQRWRQCACNEMRNMQKRFCKCVL